MAGARGGAGALAFVLGMSTDDGTESGDWNSSDESAEAPRWAGRCGDTHRRVDSLARVLPPEPTEAPCADASVSTADSRSGDGLATTPAP